jgi:hypothetical protein
LRLVGLAVIKFPVSTLVAAVTVVPRWTAVMSAITALIPITPIIAAVIPIIAAVRSVMAATRMVTAIFAVAPMVTDEVNTCTFLDDDTMVACLRYRGKGADRSDGDDGGCDDGLVSHAFAPRRCAEPSRDLMFFK